MRFDMIVEFRKLAHRGLLAACVVLALSPPLAAESGAATPSVQDAGGRFRVLVVPIDSKVLDKKFGEKVAKGLRERLEDFPTHAPVPEKEYKRALKRYDVKAQELNPIKARQLANLMGAQVVYFGTLSGSGSVYQIQARFITVKTGDEIPVPPTTVPDKSDASVNQVVEASIEAFDKQVKFERARAFCADYVGSQQPENALRNCNEALAINPISVPALFNKALAFRQLFENASDGTNGWGDSAVVFFERVLDVQPGHRDALQNAAYIYSRNGKAEKAGELYKQYLELDPGNIPVRLKVAYDLAQASLMKEAIDIIQEGLELEPNDVNLLQSLADYCLNYSTTDPSYVDCALQAYEKVLAIKGEETDPAVIENALAAYTRANRGAEAVAFAEKALQSHSESPRLWSLYADALFKLERYSDGIAAMDEVLTIDLSYPDGYLKRGRYKLPAGDEPGALADFNQAIQSGGSTKEQVFGIFWGDAHGALKEGKRSEALKLFKLTAEFAPAEKTREVEFWWGLTYFQLGEQLANPEEEGLSVLRRAKANFEAAGAHLRKAGNAHKQASRFREAAGQWLVNVEARIKQIQRRGG